MEPVVPAKCQLPVTTRCVVLALPTIPRWQVNYLFFLVRGSLTTSSHWPVSISFFDQKEIAQRIVVKPDIRIKVENGKKSSSLSRFFPRTFHHSRSRGDISSLRLCEWTYNFESSFFDDVSLKALKRFTNKLVTFKAA